MYAYFQPKISVEQEEADIKEMIDKEYEQREQEQIDYYKQMEEDYYKQMESVKNMANNSKEEGRKRQIDFLRTHYNKAIVDAAIEYADNEIKRGPLCPHDSFMLKMAKAKALDVGQQEVADFIEMQMDFDTEDLFDILTFAYVHGMFFGLSNPNINKTPEPANDYVLSKDFAFVFYFSDNDFGMYIEQAAKEYCNEYNNLLRKIEMYSGDSEIMVNSCKKGLEFMEDPNNIRELIKAGFIGEYMTGTIDRCWLDGKPQFNAMERLNKAQDLVNNYFNFKTNTNKSVVHIQGNNDIVYWKFGTWDEVSKFGLERFKSWQGEEELENANGDFTKYWLNGEVLIVRMVGGKLVAEVH